MEALKTGDFGEFKFIEEYRNGKLHKRYWEMYGTIVEIGEVIVILGNDNDRHKVKPGTLKYKLHKPNVEARDFITKHIINL